MAPQDVLDFWFTDRVQALCFEKDDALDAEIRDRFGCAVGQAQAGGYQEWSRTPAGALALIILLDQMARNIHRGTAEAFAGDGRACDVAAKAIDTGFDRSFVYLQRRFFYLPFEHSEDPAMQDRSIALFQAAVAEAPAEDRTEALSQLDYAERHAQIIHRFGRFPHRNAALGRRSTAAELAFLQEPDSSF